MVVELAPHAYPRIVPLFADLGYHVSITAVLRGTMPGRVFVDDDRSPGVALVSSPEGNYLAGAGSLGIAARSSGRALVEQLRAYGPNVELFTTPPWELQAHRLMVPTRHCRPP